MNNGVLTRSYLESLTSAELLDLADEYGIEIPVGLNRRFIVGELLECSCENQGGGGLLEAASAMEEETGLPSGYNENQISAIVRNPVWAYVMWDIRDSDLSAARRAAFQQMLCIRALRFENTKSPEPAEYFDLPVSSDDRDRYVFIPPGPAVLRFDLVLSSSTLAVSRRILFPRRLPDIEAAARMRSVSPVLQLSGLSELLKKQFEQHRQSFS